MAYLRGVNLAGLDFAPTTLPGTVGQSYFPPTAAEFDYCKSKGLTLIRLPFLWERVQPTLAGSLDPTYLGYLDTAVANAAARGMTVILDVHNYGGYSVAGVIHTIGAADGVVTQAHFTDLWTRLATHFKGQPVWYGLMNEPHDFAAGAYTANLVIHNFENGVQGVNEEGGAVVTASATAHTGTGSAQVAGVYGTGYSQVRIRANVAAGTNYGPNGNTFSAWVYVPVGITGLQAYAGYFDTAWANQPGSTVNLNAGAWTQVTTTYAGGLPAVNDLVLQVWGTGVNQTVNLLVDDWTAGSGTGGQQVWTNAAQAAINAIRATGATEKITAGGYAYSGAAAWQTNNTNFLLTDSGNNLIYEAHQYFDDDGSGTYVNPNGSTTASTYAIELNGVTDPVNSGARNLKHFTDWCAQHSVQGFIGEMGWPYDAADAANWNALANAAYAQLDSVGFPVTYWANGPSWGTYRLSAEPTGLGTGTVTDAAQMAAIAAHPTQAPPALLGVGGSSSAASATLTQVVMAQSLTGTGASVSASSASLTQAAQAAQALSGAAQSASVSASALTNGIMVGGIINDSTGAPLGDSTGASLMDGTSSPALVGGASSASAAGAVLTQTAGAATNALVGTGASASASFGTLTQTPVAAQSLVGNGASASVASGALTQTPAAGQSLAGAAASASAAGGLLTQTGAAAQALIGIGASASAASAAITQAAQGAQSLVGTASSASAAGATLTQSAQAAQVLIAGASSASAGSVALTQAPSSVTQPLAGGAASVSASSALLTQTLSSAVQNLIGGAASASAAAAALTQATQVAQSLSGGGSSGSSAGGALSNGVAGQNVLVGGASSASAGTAALTQTSQSAQSFTGGGATASAASGPLTQTAQAAQSLSGAGSSATSGTAGLTQVPVASQALAGSASSASGGTAALGQTPVPTQPLTGSGASASSASASLTQSVAGSALTGSGGSQSAAGGALTQTPSGVVQSLVGSAATFTTASGTLSQIAVLAQQLAGVAQSFSAAAAVLAQQAAGAHLLAGTAVIASSAGGALTQRAAGPVVTGRVVVTATVLTTLAATETTPTVLSTHATLLTTVTGSETAVTP